MTPLRNHREFLAKNKLFQLMQTDAYQRGLEIEREKTVDEQDDGDDDYETHMEFETRQEKFI